MTTSTSPWTPRTEAGAVTYYLVGRVPVKMQERPDGVELVAFNPLLGGYVSDARYYSTIKRHDGDEDGVYRIDEAEFERRVEQLRDEFRVPQAPGMTLG